MCGTIATCRVLGFTNMHDGSVKRARISTIARCWSNSFRNCGSASRRSSQRTGSLSKPPPALSLRCADGRTVGWSFSIKDIVKDAIEFVEEHTAGMKAKPSDVLFRSLLWIQLFQISRNPSGHGKEAKFFSRADSRCSTPQNCSHSWSASGRK